ncbi:MAG: NusG domain II-containing protein [Caldithrix sp.]|nr:MAG: NusG domain II-containing protein [Caldithrix sp.]
MKTVLQLLTRGDKILASALILISILSFTVLKAVKQPGQIAVIKVENRQKFSKNLNRAEKFSVSGHISETVIEIVDGAIRIIGSGCPQKLCVRQGSIRQIGEIIVCVPNKLIISIGGTRKDKFDAITG